MTEKHNYRDEFDRFSQHDYLQLLLKTKDDAIIPTLFLDLMDCVNAVQGRAGIILADTEDEAEASQKMPSLEEPGGVHHNAVKIMESAVDMSNVLKALMEYYEIKHGDKE